MRDKANIFILAVSLAFSLAVLPVSALPGRPDPPRLVNDLAQIFSSRQTEELEKMLVAFDDSTSNQITVVTVKDLEGYDPSEYATRIGLDWQVGSAEFDNGVVVLVKPKTFMSSGQVFIAVGYGLEGAIPDAYAKRIVENVMIPHFTEGDYYAGVREACTLLMGLASGEISVLRESEELPLFDVFVGFVIIFSIVIILLLSISRGNKGGGGNGGRRTVYVGPIITSGRSYGGSPFGGSSFGGGFGGFGGFGGGSFGGGGAGGSW